MPISDTLDTSLSLTTTSDTKILQDIYIILEKIYILLQKYEPYIQSILVCTIILLSILIAFAILNVIYRLFISFVR